MSDAVDIRETPAYRRMAQLLEAWRGVMFNERHELQLYQVLRAAGRDGPRNVALRDAIKTAVGAEGDQLKKLGRWIQRWQRRGGLRTDDWELVERRRPGGAYRLYRVVRPGTVNRFGHATTLILEPGPVAPPLPVARIAPAIDIAPPPAAEQPVEQSPLVYAYPDGSARVRGAKHFATLAKAGSDVPAGLRAVAQTPRSPIRLQPTPSVFGSTEPARVDDGPSDLFKQMTWRPPGAG